jgi:thymidylate kinase
MLRNGLAKKFPKLFQVMQFLNRKFFQIFKLPRIEDQYDLIIFDRWSLSTVAYGMASGVPQDFTVKLSTYLRKPDHTFILLGKAFPHEVEDVYEADVDLQAEVRAHYALWATFNPQSCTVIDCQQNKKKISKQICDILKSKKIVNNF